MAAASLPDLPIVGLSYLERLTDDFGIWQHTQGETVKANEGYALDDSARALVVALLYGRDDLAEVYGSFVRRACCDFETPINFFSAKCQPVRRRSWSADALGQVWWALGVADRSGRPFPWAAEVRNRLWPTLQEVSYLRPLAYACLAGDVYGTDSVYAERIMGLCEEKAAAGWYWPEDVLVYANAVIPHSLIEIGARLSRTDIAACGLRMLDFLNEACSAGDVPIAIGNRGWYPRGGEKALYDQQPIDPAYQVMANMAAYRVTGREEYRAQARRYLGWFWGDNLGGKALIDAAGGCHDGLGLDGVSPHRGAENVVCYLLAQAAFTRTNGVSAII